MKIVKKTQKRKGVFESLSNAALAMVILVITLGVGGLILQQFNTTAAGINASTGGQSVTQTTSVQVITQGVSSLSTFASFFNVIVVTVIGVALFILILAGLARFRGQGSSDGF